MLCILFATIPFVVGGVSPFDLLDLRNAFSQSSSTLPPSVRLVETADLPPIVMLPGLTAANLSASIRNVKLCKTTQGDDRFEFWPIGGLFQIGCIGKVFPLKFNATTKTLYEPDGVHSDVEHFGTDLDGLTYGPHVVPNVTAYNYVIGENVFGTPFDWRRTDLFHGLWYARMKAFIEKVYNDTGKQVVMLAPSFGPQNALAFLHRMTQAWKDKHISWFIAESPVWSGTPFPLDVFMSGLSAPEEVNGEDVTAKARARARVGVGVGASGNWFRTLAINAPGVMWLSPQLGKDEYTWGPDEMIVQTLSRNYTANDIPQLLADVGFADYVPLYKYMQQNSCLSGDNFKAPGVNTFIAYGTQLPTPVQFVYNSTFDGVDANHPAPPADTIMGDGDGIVPVRSSLRGMQWVSEQNKLGKKLIHKEYVKQLHASCILISSTDTCFDDVMQLIIHGTVPEGAVVGNGQ